MKATVAMAGSTQRRRSPRHAAAAPATTTPTDVAPSPQAATPSKSATPVAAETKENPAVGSTPNSVRFHHFPREATRRHPSRAPREPARRPPARRARTIPIIRRPALTSAPRLPPDRADSQAPASFHPLRGEQDGGQIAQPRRRRAQEAQAIHGVPTRVLRRGHRPGIRARVPEGRERRRPGVPGSERRRRRRRAGSPETSRGGHRRVVPAAGSRAGGALRRGQPLR